MLKQKEAKLLQHKNSEEIRFSDEMVVEKERLGKAGAVKGFVAKEAVERDIAEHDIDNLLEKLKGRMHKPGLAFTDEKVVDLTNIIKFISFLSVYKYNQLILKFY